MARTALDLTVQEWQAYHPGDVCDNANEAARTVEMRWQEAWRVARSAAHVLRRQFGVRRVVVFGSLAHRMWFTPWSDIDLAAWGIPHDRFYTAVAAVTGLSTDFKLDLVDPGTCRPAVREALEREGIEL